MSGRKGTVLVPPRVSGSRGSRGYIAQFVLGEADGVYGVQPVFVGTNILNPVRVHASNTRPVKCASVIAVAPLLADIIFDIKLAGVSIFNAPVHHPDGAYAAVSTDVNPSVLFTEGDILTFDMIQVGSSAPGGEPGRGLTVYLYYE